MSNIDITKKFINHLTYFNQLKLTDNQFKQLYFNILQKTIVSFIKQGKYNKTRSLLIHSFKELRTKFNEFYIKNNLNVKLPFEFIFIKILIQNRIFLDLKKIKIRRHNNYIPYIIIDPTLQLLKGLKLFINTKRRHKNFIKTRIITNLFTSLLENNPIFEERNLKHLNIQNHRFNFKYNWPEEPLKFEVKSN